MLSPSDLARRVGVGGGLVPFFKCVCVYFALGGEAPGAAAVAAKCAPVLSLLAAVLLLPRASADEQCDKKNRRYARLVALGLLASAGGDALLVWPAQLLPGMALFAAAHACYGAAFTLRARTARPATAALLFALAALYCWRVRAPGPLLRALVPAYAALLAGMAWRAQCTLPGRRHARALAAPAGALLFALSDAVLGYSLFSGPVPYRQVLVMSTYYLGQLGIALSALLPPEPPKTPAATPAVPATPAAPLRSS